MSLLVYRGKVDVNLRIFLPLFIFKYRDRATIIGDILSSLSINPRGRRKTNIKQSAGLNNDMLNRYLDLLMRNGYVMVDSGDVYKLTQRGLRLLQNLDVEYLRMSMKT